MESDKRVVKLNGFTLKMTVPNRIERRGRTKGFKQSKEEIQKKIEARTKLNVRVQAIIVEGVRNGLSLRRSAALVKISPFTISRWYRWGRDYKSPIYTNFYEACKLAEAQCEESCILVVRKAIEGKIESTKEKSVYSNSIDPETGERKLKSFEIIKTKNAPSWTAAMTFLERKYPERWGRNDRLSVGSDPNNPIVPKEDILNFLTGYIGAKEKAIDVKQISEKTL